MAAIHTRGDRSKKMARIVGQNVNWRHAFAALALLASLAATITIAAAALPQGAPLATVSAGNVAVPYPCSPSFLVVPSANAAQPDVLNAVAAVSTNNVWTVGSRYDANAMWVTLIEHWDGTAWSIVPSPDPAAGTYIFLNGVAAVSTNDIWAVGTYLDTVSTHHRVLTEHWDGVSWTIVPGSNPVNASDYRLNAVSAVASNDVWATGDVGNIAILFEHWDGAAWSVVPGPNPPNVPVYMTGIKAIASNDVWAVGYYDNFPSHTLVTHWDGAAWSIVAAPDPSPSSLSGISGTASNNVWAVGTYRPAGVNKTLVEHWDGTNWTQVATPSVGTINNNFLSGVAADSMGGVWAVGWYTVTNSTNEQTLAERWDGAAWSIVPSENPGTQYNDFYGVAAVSPTEVWAAGALRDNGGTYTLMERYAGQCPTATPTACAVDNPVQEGFENGNLGAFASTSYGGAPGWSVVADAYHGGTHSAFAPDFDNISDQRLTLINQVPIPASASSATLSFWHRFEFEYDNQGNYDGAVLEVSIDNGVIWVDAGSNILSGGYNGTIDTCCGNPLGGQSAWVAGTLGSFSQVTVDLLPYRGQSILFRFREGTDSSNDFPTAYGWWVDDVQLSIGQTGCTPAPTSTPTFTETPTQTPTHTNTPLPTQTPGGPTATRVPSATHVPTGTPSRTNTPLPTQTPGGPTATRVPTNTPVPTSTPGGPTPTACTLQFSDVPQGSTFYAFIRCLACRGIINGYADGTFKPNNNVTRGQLSKIVSNAAGFSENQPNQMFQDVPAGSTFFQYIGRLASRGFIGGYTCGGSGEPCVPPGNLPYFRPNNDSTRGQISKIVSNAAGYADTPGGQQFQDVPAGSTYYAYIYRLVSRSIMAGYPCGGAGEPCIPPGNLPYFRPNNNATRGQTSKIVANTFFPNCNTPARK
jgi:hypothetical protein